MRDMRFVGLCAIALASMVSSVNAQDIPRYDVEGRCNGSSWGALKCKGNSVCEFNECIDKEQTVYNKIKESWNSVPSKVKKYCDKSEYEKRYQSYVFMERCIQQEIAKKNFQY